MPDKFLISKRVQEARAPESIYSNKQMNTFFGCNMAEPDNKTYRVEKNVLTKIDRSLTKQGPQETKKTRQTRALRKKIFSECVPEQLLKHPKTE